MKLLTGMDQTDPGEEDAMLYTTNVIPQHQTALHCEWRLIRAKATAQLTAIWIDTPQPDFPKQDSRKPAA